MSFTLALLLEDAKRHEVPKRLKADEKLRLERTSRIQAVARDSGRFYRPEYEDAAERDRLMSKWMAATGWIRGHDAEKTAQEALLLADRDAAIR
jgi:salicylate hydroxylase